MQFDVEDEVRVQLALEHAEPETAIANISAQFDLAANGVQLVADPRGDRLVFVGPSSYVKEVEEILRDVDVAEDPRAVDTTGFTIPSQPTDLGPGQFATNKQSIVFSR